MFRSSHLQLRYKKVVLTNFATFTGKISFPKTAKVSFLKIKLQALSLHLFKEQTLLQVSSGEF